ncbi:MAG: riboflavin biosynthesis protein RibF [Proteobacteria bacterium]|nr:MAG: riboflavin biosynthesis protein RibF [Pseudomonadota bacterium]
MKVYWDVDQLPDTPVEPVATMGNLDGIHRGHQVIISRLQQEAERIGAETLVITFEPHTRRVVRPHDDFRTVMTLKEKLGRLHERDVDHVLVLPFADGYAEMSAKEFIEEVIWEPLHVRAMYVGHDAGFGKRREGDVRLLTSEGRRLGFHVGVVDPLLVGGKRVSSSRVRAAVTAGKLDVAARLLGRDHVVSGMVMRGFRRGRELGFPTANISDEATVLPPHGVYVGWAQTQDNCRHGAMINVGTRPTFDNGAVSVEAHLFNYSGDLYGQELRVSLRQRLRGEVQFDDPDQLRIQLKKDAVDARKLLGIKRAKAKGG